MSARVEQILSWYAHENEGVRQNLRRFLMQGRLAGTGRLLIYPVDQGVEHGPARTYAPNPAAYDPDYFFDLSLKAGVSGYAAPLGQIAAARAGMTEKVPTILKINSAVSMNDEKRNALTATLDDALRLKCAAIGYTLYPGSPHFYQQVEQLVPLLANARKAGLPTVIWAYPRGGKISKEGETALDIVAYSAHVAAQLGGHIIKVKLPTDFIEDAEAKKAYQTVPAASLAARVSHVVQSTFDGKRIVLFTGGPMKDEQAVLDEAQAIRDGGGFGSILGRNATQRAEPKALRLFESLIDIYKS